MPRTRPSRHPFEPDDWGDCKRCNLPQKHKVHADLSAQPMLVDEEALRAIIREEIRAWLAESEPTTT